MVIGQRLGLSFGVAIALFLYGSAGYAGKPGLNEPTTPSPEVAPPPPINVDGYGLDGYGPGSVTHVQISLSDRRLTLYQNSTALQTYPIAVGREGWQTPVGQFQVTQMIANPDWMNPLTGEVVRSGHPSNPLGDRWIGFWTDGYNWVGMHGTPDTSSIGQAASHGCIRLLDHHIDEIFRLVQLGTIVVVVP